MLAADDVDIAIAWEGLPPYGAAGLRHAAQKSQQRFRVLATRPSVPFADNDIDVGAPVTWVTRGARLEWHDIQRSTPRLFIHTGWAYRHWNHLADRVLRNGGQVVAMVDNRWKGSLRQWLGAVYFRANLRRRFYRVWVPGASATKLMRVFGMRTRDVVTGLYGANTELFYGGESVALRRRQFLFSGQLIGRKGVDILQRAWRVFAKLNPEWRLVVCGAGAEEVGFRDLVNVDMRGFTAPSVLANVMRESRFLILPSRDEHWGVVVHEAASCGCGLLLSDAVGAAQDLMGRENGVEFAAGSVGSLLASLERAARCSDRELIAAERESRVLAKKFGSSVWAEKFAQLAMEANMKYAHDRTGYAH